MNDDQRKRLEKATEIVEQVYQEEEEKLENMYDSFSETQKYADMEEQKDSLEEAKNILDEVINDVR